MRESLNRGGDIACLACLTLLALLFGCGYQFRVEGAGPTIGTATAASSSTTPPPRLVVRTLENKSFEPNLEARYTNYLRHEFSSGSGAQIVPESEAADLVLSGQILSVSLPTLSFTQTTTLESRAEVVVMVKVEVLPVVDVGVNEAFAPAGRPLIERLTEPEKFLRLIAREKTAFPP